MTTPRKHAELAARYMADSTLEVWVRNSANDWDRCIGSPGWLADFEYYVGHEPPPTEITVCGRQMPAPMKEPPPLDSEYWVDSVNRAVSFQWRGSPADFDFLRAGYCHRNESDAQQWRDLNREMRTGRTK